jgi:hypothetical protein
MQKIRVWKLGSLEHQIMPDESAYDKLKEILESIPSGGTADIIWGPALEVFEVYPDKDGIVVNSKDFVVSAGELKQAIDIVMEKRKESQKSS